MERTSCAWSISHWMASVISSSPAPGRLDGAHRLVDRRGEEVDADERQIALGALRLLLQADHAAGIVELGHAERRGLGTWVSRIWASGRLARGTRPPGR